MKNLKNFVPSQMDGNDSVWEESMAHGTLLIKVASSRIIFTEILRCPPGTLGEPFKCIWRAPHLWKYPSVERGVILCLLLDRCKNPPTPIELVCKDSHHSTPCALPTFRFVWGSPQGFRWVKLVGVRHFQSITHPQSRHRLILSPLFWEYPPILPSAFTRQLTICNPVKGPLQPDVAPLG